MAETTEIAWCDSTFNPWAGCTKVSPGCTNCYAEKDTKRRGYVRWGPGAERRRTKTWGQPRKWDREHEAFFAEHGRRRRVFCASWADWLDPEVPVEWLADLLELIAVTPHLDWLLLTKRPELWRGRMEEARDGFQLGHEGSTHLSEDARVLIYNWVSPLHRTPPQNVWMLATAEDQQRLGERLPELLRIPALVRGLSCEPLLGPLSMEEAVPEWWESANQPLWIIGGGESGQNARPCHPDWARSLRDQCAGAGVPFLWKQWGAWAPIGPANSEDRAEEVAVESSGSISQWWDRRTSNGGCHHQPGSGAWWMSRVGKKLAGRLLDGVTHNEFPL